MDLGFGRARERWQKKSEERFQGGKIWKPTKTAPSPRPKRNAETSPNTAEATKRSSQPETALKQRLNQPSRRANRAMRSSMPPAR